MANSSSVKKTFAHDGKSKRIPVDLTPKGGGFAHRWIRKFAILVSLLAAMVVIGQPWLGSRVDEEIHSLELSNWLNLNKNY